MYSVLRTQDFQETVAVMPVAFQNCHSQDRQLPGCNSQPAAYPSDSMPISLIVKFEVQSSLAYRLLIDPPVENAVQ
jgi:hypothetical protein